MSENNEFPGAVGLADPDGFYERLLALYDGVDADRQRLLDARLILLMADYIGDQAVLDRLMEAAREDLRGDRPDSP